MSHVLFSNKIVLLYRVDDTRSRYYVPSCTIWDRGPVPIGDDFCTRVPIGDDFMPLWDDFIPNSKLQKSPKFRISMRHGQTSEFCLLYTSDAADE